MLDVDVEALAFEKGFKVAVVLEYWVGGDFVHHTFEGHSSRVDEVNVESANGLFFRWWRDDNAGAVVVHALVEP